MKKDNRGPIFGPKEELHKRLFNLFSSFTEEGVYLCDLPTGSGKSHTIAEAFCGPYYRTFKMSVYLGAQRKLVDETYNRIKSIAVSLKEKETPILNPDTEMLHVRNNKENMMMSFSPGSCKETLLDDLIADIETFVYRIGCGKADKVEFQSALTEIKSSADDMKSNYNLYKTQINLDDSSDASLPDQILNNCDYNLRKKMREFFNLYKSFCLKKRSKTPSDSEIISDFPSIVRVYPESAYKSKKALQMSKQGRCTRDL